MQTIKEITGNIETLTSPERKANCQGNFYKDISQKSIGPGMNERIQRLRKLSLKQVLVYLLREPYIKLHFTKKI